MWPADSATGPPSLRGRSPMEPPLCAQMQPVTPARLSELSPGGRRQGWGSEGTREG